MRARMIALGVAAVLGSTVTAHAFCGFYVGGAGAQMFNNATEVVLVRHGTTTVLSMQNNYQGPPEKFALVVPVPVVVREPQVKTLPREVFAKVDVLGAPRLVEYWEADPCAADYDDGDDWSNVKKSADMGEDEDEADSSEKDYKVKIEAKFSVGEYNIVVLSAQESTGLERWLHANKYEIPTGAAPLLRPYIELGMKFFVAKVDPKKVVFTNGQATLSPLRFYYDSADFTLPIRLGLANSSGTQDLIVNILAPNQRYEAANHPNVTIPTNLPVHDVVRTRFGEFYAALFDHTLEEVPNAVVTEYAWDSGSCDPCPGPVLDANDLATLGADIIGATYKDASPYYTLTRLHARYGKDLKDDLVFRAVEPIVGGRGVPDANGALDTNVSTTGSNNFQGRYVIMHPWSGAVACASPNRGRWGGPPNGQQIATPATNTAFAPRGKLELASMVAATPQIGTLASKGSMLPMPVRQPRANGCGCQAAGSGAAAGAGALGVGLLLLRKRRRRSA
ncbi:MAG: DUF2330 domain-containing protein [Myxococcales bacterium]|nr:DUF2330 domain-containing protein [Myxococcales bacterium]